MRSAENPPLNVCTRAQAVKVVVTGPPGTGKTTLISTIGEAPARAMEAGLGDPSRPEPQPTVAMDFGRLTIDGDLSLSFFGTPGERRFEFMWEILAEGMLGFILLVDHARMESLDEAMPILDVFRAQSAVPFVVGVNNVADGDIPTALARARTRLQLRDSHRVVAVDVRDRESVKDLVVELLQASLEDIEPGTITWG
jgi:uncharacterized protein